WRRSSGCCRPGTGWRSTRCWSRSASTSAPVAGRDARPARCSTCAGRWASRSIAEADHFQERRAMTQSVGKNLKELYDLIEGIEIAMFTTRRSDGHLVSRPMATQTQAEGADLWFVTDIESHKLDELELDPHVNLAYYRDRTREWVSVSGTA